MALRALKGSLISQGAGTNWYFEGHFCVKTEHKGCKQEMVNWNFIAPFTEHEIT